jgi:hypothetical protein
MPLGKSALAQPQAEPGLGLDKLATSFRPMPVGTVQITSAGLAAVLDDAPLA